MINSLLKYLILLNFIICISVFSQVYENEEFIFMKTFGIKKTIIYEISIDDSLKVNDTALYKEYFYDRKHNTFIFKFYPTGQLFTGGYYEYDNSDKIVFSSFKIFNEFGKIHSAMVTFYDFKGRELEKLYYDEKGLKRDRSFYFYPDSISLVTEKYIFFGDTNVTKWRYEFNEIGKWIKRIRMWDTGDTSEITERKFDNYKHKIEEITYYQNVDDYNNKKTFLYNDRGQLIESVDDWSKFENKLYKTFYYYDEYYLTNSLTYCNDSLMEILIYRYEFY